MTLASFSEEEFQKAKLFLCARVAYMMGRKFEEDDWTYVYCKAKGFPSGTWSNLNVDIEYNGLSLELKQMKRSDSESILNACGTELMHPSLTRRINLPESSDPNTAMRSVILQYQKVLDERYTRIKDKFSSFTPDLRSGWLLYDSSLTEFLYFEEQSKNIKPEDHTAEWSERSSRSNGGRRSNKNLWIYNKHTGNKVWSVTGGSSGTKIQPYFRVPPKGSADLHYFRVQGIPIDGGNILIFVTAPTANQLEKILGSDYKLTLNDVIIRASSGIAAPRLVSTDEPIVDIVISVEAYSALLEKFPGVSDEHRVQLLCETLAASE
jgi:hypothetical protein